MALGPYYNSSSISATPTSSTSSSAPPTDNSGNSSSNGTNGFFDSAASPPLILAFLAIGLFAIATMGVVGWRRLNLGRGLILTPFGVEIVRPHAAMEMRQAGVELGEKPGLWDLWTLGGKGRWDLALPIGAMVMPLHVGDENGQHGHSSATPSSSSRHLLQFRRHHRQTPIPHPDVNANDPNVMHSRLQVAIAIAMPSPRTRHQPSPSEDTTTTGSSAETRSSNEEESLEYCIGLYQRLVDVSSL
ncbi:hypothetical protein JAAARDRAFT_209983 [Jaapia argillacea MUCL 33604]|uniref:Uncharacterized protein n=1 Tax=Jaapia argillacea MUCL 33604 TaxID=933084 RepID=A0A067PED9_9AGAM|nr:hypothetical protein JAAARDRAFT_209983 [Jaapia argillacea MUCL 33604]